ncbi:hypothetical protein HDU79_010777 [Rhizoclosmatium sp. JEL0117]|nr:hypothetical protein HDU79_010777 [Rhizoclosmatium sp. JEL0117]
MDPPTLATATVPPQHCEPMAVQSSRVGPLSVHSDTASQLTPPTSEVGTLNQRAPNFNSLPSIRAQFATAHPTPLMPQASARVSNTYQPLFHQPLVAPPTLHMANHIIRNDYHPYQRPHHTQQQHYSSGPSQQSLPRPPPSQAQHHQHHQHQPVHQHPHYAHPQPQIYRPIQHPHPYTHQQTRPLYHTHPTTASSVLHSSQTNTHASQPQPPPSSILPKIPSPRLTTRTYKSRKPKPDGPQVFLTPPTSGSIRATKPQLNVLYKIFAENPMPSGEMHAAIGLRIGMKKSTVRNWFQNQRAKAKKQQTEGHDDQTAYIGDLNWNGAEGETAGGVSSLISTANGHDDVERFEKCFEGFKQEYDSTVEEEEGYEGEGDADSSPPASELAPSSLVSEATNILALSESRRRPHIMSIDALI